MASFDSQTIQSLAAAGCTEEVLRRVALDPEVIEERGYGDWRPLHYAVAYERRETVNALLDAGAKLESKASGNETPLHVASRLKKPDMVQTLLQRGARTEAKSEGNTPLLRACDEECENLAVVEALVLGGANCNVMGPSGSTPFLLACKHRYENVAIFLAERGADIKVVDGGGKGLKESQFPVDVKERIQAAALEYEEIAQQGYLMK